MGIRAFSALIAIVSAVVVGDVPAITCADGAMPSSRGGIARDLMARDLVGVPGKELRMLMVEYPPGAASLPHRHNAQVFVYVLEGAVRMQVEGSPAVTLGPGDTFYEGPDDIHTVSANASPTRAARILVFMVKEKNAPVSSAVTPKERR